MIRFVGLVALLACTACATSLSPQASRVREADERMVRRCAFLGTVRGSSLHSGAFRETGRTNALNEGLEQAAALGATHVLWVRQTGSYWSGGDAVGRAYRCPRGR